MEVYVDFEHGGEELACIDVEGIARFVVESEDKPESSELSIRFVTDEEMASLNEEYRGKVGPTDVLSFECDGLDDDFGAMGDEQLDVPFELGDIVIAPDVARRQTLDFGTSFEGEITLLLVHGLLHLCGYDHIDDDEADVMEARERELLGLWADQGHEGVRHVRDDTIRVRGEH